MDLSELIAVISSGGVNRINADIFSRRLLDAMELMDIASSDVVALMTITKIPRSVAIKITAACELGRRVSGAKRRDRIDLRTPEQVFQAFVSEMGPLPHEELWCLPLDVHSRLIGEPRVVSKGDIDGTDASPRSFFRLALIAGATSCIALHNHPTGDPTASASDRQATTRLAAAGRAVNVPLNDHLILGDGGRFVSLRRTEPSLFNS
jgi:DNA repair protein RadC